MSSRTEAWLLRGGIGYATLMSDEQDRAEALDDEILSDAGTSDADRFVELPAEEYPLDEPLGVDDPEAIGVSDDVVDRERREQPDDPEARPDMPTT